MELKNAVAVCLISLFSATLVVAIAKSLDSQAASRIEGQLARVVEELQALRKQGGLAPPGGSTASEAADAGSGEAMENGLVVYYFHSNTRCPTCQAIQSQSHAVVKSDFAGPLGEGKIAWKVVNYEQSSAAGLAGKFEVQMPVVVLVRMKNGKIDDWKRLDEVWGLVGDQQAFAAFLRKQIDQMLHAAASSEKPSAAADPPAPAPGDLPIPE